MSIFTFWKRNKSKAGNQLKETSDDTKVQDDVIARINLAGSNARKRLEEENAAKATISMNRFNEISERIKQRLPEIKRLFNIYEALVKNGFIEFGMLYEDRAGELVNDDGSIYYMDSKRLFTSFGFFENYPVVGRGSQDIVFGLLHGESWNGWGGGGYGISTLTGEIVEIDHSYSIPIWKRFNHTYSISEIDFISDTLSKVESHIDIYAKWLNSVADSVIES